MISDAIEGAYALFKADPRLNNDIGTNTKVLFFSKTVEDEPTCYPFITFSIDPITEVKVVSLGKKNQRNTPLKILCGISDYNDVWDAQLEIDALIKNIEAILMENPKLDGKVYTSQVIQETYGYILDNDGNPFAKVCEITLQVSELFNTNLC